ncbi:recombination protein NinG [Solemya elarraichensis gill symbiont]|uniref:recombination protein NinG n=1 Tax=Solemya elarraichensis gill symbiont TaxID=1918949 RepID=UPI001FEA15E2|nr:recombination protein NinG [Solemya elarraichensis gill symbiont]
MRVCKVCRTKFDNQVNPQQIVCSPKCGIAYVRQAKEKEWRKEKKRRLEKIKTRSEYLAETQKAFNAYIRFRDAGQGCISCGNKAAVQYHAGHYRTVKAVSALRFDEDNVHMQCSQCNCHDSGNICEYRIRLRRKIGDWRLERIENDRRTLNCTKEEVIEIRDFYRA